MTDNDSKSPAPGKQPERKIDIIKDPANVQELVTRFQVPVAIPPGDGRNRRCGLMGFGGGYFLVFENNAEGPRQGITLFLLTAFSMSDAVEFLKVVDARPYITGEARCLKAEASLEFIGDTPANN